MPFGLCNDPCHIPEGNGVGFQRVAVETMSIYLDDLLVYAKNFEEMAYQLNEVLDRVRQANLKLKPTKCHLFRDEVAYLGHILSGEGIRPNPENVENIQN